MTKKRIKTLEAIMDALNAEKQTVLHSSDETNLIVDKIIDYQVIYKRATGHYYHRKFYSK